MSDSRAAWDYYSQDPWRAPEDGIFITANDAGLHVSVSQEKAVGSYNSQFDCSIDLPRDQVQLLRDFLSGWLDRGTP